MTKAIGNFSVWIVKWLVIDLFILVALIIVGLLGLLMFADSEDSYSPEDYANCRPPTHSCEFWGA